jgi:hypothetical protein
MPPMPRLTRKSPEERMPQANNLPPRLARYIADMGCFAAADALADRSAPEVQSSKTIEL